jgi:hypothetical protein
VSLAGRQTFQKNTVIISLGLILGSSLTYDAGSIFFHNGDIYLQDKFQNPEDNLNNPHCEYLKLINILLPEDQEIITKL